MLVSVCALHHFSHDLEFVLVQKMHYLFDSTHKLLQLAVDHRRTCMYKGKQVVMK